MPNDLQERLREESAKISVHLRNFKIAMVVVLFLGLSGALIRSPIIVWCILVTVHLIAICLVFAQRQRTARMKHHRAYIHAVAKNTLDQLPPFSSAPARRRAMWWSLALTLIAALVYLVVRDSVQLLGWVLSIALIYGTIAVVQSRHFHDQNHQLSERAVKGELK
jgi:Mg2+/citrate symporter